MQTKPGSSFGTYRRDLVDGGIRLEKELVPNQRKQDSAGNLEKKLLKNRPLDSRPEPEREPGPAFAARVEDPIPGTFELAQLQACAWPGLEASRKRETQRTKVDLGNRPRQTGSAAACAGNIARGAVEHQ